MASPSLGYEIFSCGFRFNPSPLDAATYYIPRLAAGAPLHEAVRPAVHHADVYTSEPADLARRFPPMPKTGDRFFFSSRNKKGARAAGLGSWYLQSTKAVKDPADQTKAGEVRKLRYKKDGVFTDWLMDEFSTLCSEEAAAGDRQFVLCNIYVSPRAAPDSAARRESAAYFAPPAPAVIPKAAAAATKRPAPPQVAEPPCPKRMRGAVVAPIPPVLQPAGYCTASFAPPRPCVPYTAASAPPPPPLPPRFAAPPLLPTRLAPPPPSVPTRIAAPPPSVPTRSAVPPPPSVPTRSAVPPPPVPTRIAVPPPPVPTRIAAPPSNRRSEAPTTPQKPKQQTPLPTPPLVRACQIPAVQATARQCPPHPSEKKQRILDPFEAAGMTDEAEDLWDELKNYLDEDAEGSTFMTEDEMEQHVKSLLED
ncbi:unnamed protein product [Urochloa humidicola]